MNDGMLASSKCRFCGEYGDKKRPCCCPLCFEMALELAEEEGWQLPETSTNRTYEKLTKIHTGR